MVALKDFCPADCSPAARSILSCQKSDHLPLGAEASHFVDIEDEIMNAALQRQKIQYERRLQELAKIMSEEQQALEDRVASLQQELMACKALHAENTKQLEEDWAASLQKELLACQAQKELEEDRAASLQKELLACQAQHAEKTHQLEEDVKHLTSENVNKDVEIRLLKVEVAALRVQSNMTGSQPPSPPPLQTGFASPIRGSSPMRGSSPIRGSLNLPPKPIVSAPTRMYTTPVSTTSGRASVCVAPPSSTEMYLASKGSSPIRASRVPSPIIRSPPICASPSYPQSPSFVSRHDSYRFSVRPMQTAN